MKLPNLIQKIWKNQNTIRIGINNSINKNINRSINFPVLFIPKKCVIENIGVYVNKNQIIASLYNEDTRCEYLFYSPIKGTIIKRNQNIIDNLQSIYINKTNDNWLVDIEPCGKNENDKDEGEKQTKKDGPIKTKYNWYY